MTCTADKATGTGTGHTTYIHLVFKILKFSLFLSKAFWFQEKVKNGIIIASTNDLHKLPIVILRETPKPLSIKAPKMVR